MRATALPLPQPAEPPEGASGGDRALLGSGLAVTLGPGLVAGGALLARVFTRLEQALGAAFDALGAQPAALPASEGEALLNVALHAGPLQHDLPRTLRALGTGFREQPRPEQGLAGLALYRRLDVVQLTAADGAPAASLLEALRGAVRRLGLAGEAAALSTSGEPHDRDLALGARALGRVFERPLGAADDAPRAGLLGLDLHALLAAAADAHHDAEGLAWPASLAPFDLGILPGAADDTASRTRAAKLHETLERAGLAVLLDDRDRRPADARRDLRAWGLPAAVLFGPGLPEDQVLLELRSGGPPAPVPESELLTRLGVRPGDAARRRGTGAARANY